MTDQANVPEKVEEKQIMPKFFIDPEERIKISVDVLYAKDTKRIYRTTRSGLLEKVSSDSFGVEFIIFEFTIPNYEEINRYLLEAQVFNYVTGKKYVDQFAFKEAIFSSHLKDWDLKDETGNKIALDFKDNNGKKYLSKESLSFINRLSPSIMTVVFSLLEGEVDLYTGEK